MVLKGQRFQDMDEIQFNAKHLYGEFPKMISRGVSKSRRNVGETLMDSENDYFKED